MRRKSWVFSAAAVSVAAAAAAGCGGSEKKVAKPLTRAGRIAMVRPSVIQVFGKSFGDVYSGTGVIIDTQKKLAITNAHVTEGLASMKARTGSFETPAQLVATAPCDDVSVIRLTALPPGAKQIQFATTAQTVRAGQSVEAFGYPGSFEDYRRQKLNVTEGTATVDGTVSASPEDDLPQYTSVIQHQAPIGHGSSGGPLVNQQGKMLGINTLGNNPDESQNQAYAISVDRIKDVLPSLRSGKSIAYVGWSLFPAKDLTDEDIRTLGWDLDPGGTGMAVAGVDSGSSADRHHFGFGDYIEHIENDEVKTAQDVCDILETKRTSVITVDGRYMGGPKRNTTWSEQLRVR